MVALSLLGCRWGEHVIYQKYIVCTMVCFSLLILYGTRHSLGITAHKLLSANATTKIAWSGGEEYYVETCFYTGYILGQLPSGMLSDLYGAKVFLALGTFGSALCNTAIPYIIIHLPWYYAGVMRFIIGTMQGVSMPALITLMAQWIPHRQLTFLVAYGYSGGCLGKLISYLVADLLAWQYLFWFWASLAAVWLIAFMCMVQSQAYKHPFASDLEKQEMASEVGTSLPRNVPWVSIFSDSGLWAMVAGQFGHIFFLSMVDGNMVRIFKATGTDLRENIYLVTMPYVAQFISTVAAGYLINYLIINYYIPVVYARTVCTIIGNLLPCMFWLLATYTFTNKLVVLLCFVLSMIAKGAIFSGIKSNILDLTRHYGGCIQSLHNGIPTTASVIAPLLTKFMCSKDVIEEWRKVIFTVLTVCLFTTTCYFIWAKGERAKWDVVDYDRKLKENQLHDYSDD